MKTVIVGALLLIAGFLLGHWFEKPRLKTKKLPVQIEAAAMQETVQEVPLIQLKTVQRTLLPSGYKVTLTKNGKVVREWKQPNFVLRGESVELIDNTTAQVKSIDGELVLEKISK